jgi:hypothetical protein
MQADYSLQSTCTFRRLALHFYSLYVAAQILSLHNPMEDVASQSLFAYLDVSLLPPEAYSLLY